MVAYTGFGHGYARLNTKTFVQLEFLSDRVISGSKTAVQCW